MADSTRDPTSPPPESHRPVDSASGALRLIWVRLGRWIAYPLLIIATFLVSYDTGRYFFEKIGYHRGFRTGHASMSFADHHTLIANLTKWQVEDSICDDARNSVFAQAGQFDYLHLAAYPHDMRTYGDRWQTQQWLVARFDMVHANKLVTEALAAQPTIVPRFFHHDDYFDKVEQLSSDEWPMLAADLELDTVLVPVFTAISPVVQFRWCYAGTDRLHYVVEP